MLTSSPTVKRTVTVIRPGDLKALKKPKYDESDHPRDRRGRWVEVGGIVSIFGGGQATVLGSVGGGRIEVEKADGRKITLDAGQTTMIRSADEARAHPLTPASVGDAAASAGPEGDGGRPRVSAPETPTEALPGATPTPGADPSNAVSYLRGADGSQAWLERAAGPEMTGFLQRTEDPAPLQFEDVERWAAEVDKLDMEPAEVPAAPGGAPAADAPPADAPAVPGTPAADAAPDEEVPDLSAVRSRALRSDRTASPDQVDQFLHQDLGDVTPAFREAGGDALAQQAKLGGATVDESNRQAKQAKQEVAADITDRMREIPDDVMLQQGDIDRLARIEAGSHVLVRKPYTLFDGTVKQRISDPDNPTVRDQLHEWQYMEVPKERFDVIDINGPDMPPGLEVVTADQWRDWKREERVDATVQLWALQSNGVNPHALAMQDTAAELFGLEDVADWPAYEDFPDLRDQVAESKDANRDFNEAFLLAMYESTQDRFREAGIKEVTVYRGHKAYTGTPEWAAPAAEGPAVVDDLTLRPLSSFSADPAVAGSFARGTSTDEAYIIEGTVPVDRIIATPRSGFGSLSEAEMVVLAGPGEWNVRAASDVDGPRVNDEFDPFGDDLADEEYGDEVPFNPVEAPAGLIGSREELMAAVAGADTDERRQALMTRAAGLGLGEIIPATWQQDGSVVEEEAPRDENGKLPPMTDQEYADRVSKVQAAIDAAVGAGLETHLTYTMDEAGTVWEDERRRKHDEIIDEVWATVANVPNEGRAYFTGGLGGAGKSSGLESLKVDESQYVNINPDNFKDILAAKGMVPEIPADIDLSPLERAALIHEESSHLAGLLAARAYREKKNVLWDMTMGSEKSVTSRISAMREAGYTEFQAMFMNVPIELSVKRALKRHRGGADKYRNGEGQGGRYVPPAIIRKNKSTEWPSANRAVMEATRDLFDKWTVYDNDVPKGTPPTRLYGKFDPDVEEKTAYWKDQYARTLAAAAEEPQ